MKKLLITLCILVATIAFPSSVFSQQEDKTWQKGDLLVARHICKTEDAIMKVIVTPYKDFAGKDSVALALQDPANETSEIFAYAIALGVVKKVKGI